MWCERDVHPFFKIVPIYLEKYICRHDVMTSPLPFDTLFCNNTFNACVQYLNCLFHMDVSAQYPKVNLIFKFFPHLSWGKTINKKNDEILFIAIFFLKKKDLY